MRQLAVLILLAVVGACGRAPDPDIAHDTILHNGNVITVDASFSSADAVAITAGRFVAVGTNDDIRALAGPATRLIDLNGYTVVPGLADGHLHNGGGGPGVDLSQARSLADVKAAIAARALETDTGELIVTNSDWHEAQLAEHELPLRRDLDMAAPDHPVVVVRGGHEYILNTVALRKWEIDELTPVPEGGRITRYPDGSLNGELVDTAKRYVTLPSPPERSLDERIASQRADYAKLHSAGLTSVRHPGASIEQYRLLQEMQRRGELTMRVNFLLRPTQTADAVAVDAELEAWGVQPDEGDQRLRIGGIKLGVDGGFEGGWMREPYAQPFDQDGTYYGLRTMSDAAFIGIARLLNQRGWRVAAHAVGDAAIDLVLDGFEAAHAEAPLTGKRWSIEHGFIPRDDHLARMREVDLVISAQNHLYLAGPSLVKYWGAERAAWTTPVRRYLDEALPVAAGTDSAVVPYPPLWTIYHFVTRNTMNSGVFGEDQRITREEALRASTMGNAHLTFEENVKGSIEPGKLADLVVLSDDIMTCPPEQIEQMTVLMTMVGGEVVYAHLEFGVEDLKEAVRVESDTESE